MKEIYTPLFDKDYKVKSLKEYSPTEENDVWYAGDYYDTQGGHGQLQTRNNFRAAYKDAMDLWKRDLDDTGYIGVSGSGNEFAIIMITDDYIRTTNANYFKSRQAYSNWMKVAQKVLRSGKPMIGSYE